MASAGTVSVIIKAVDKTKATVEKAQSRFSKFTEKIKSLSTLQIGALTGVAYSFGKIVQGASDIVEAQNKAEVVFGKASAKIVKFAKEQAIQYGFTTAEAMEYAGTLGQILSASGLTEDAAADMSIKLEKLAADLASINNIPVADALEKIRAGLVGEAEPLRSVGVLLSEQEVKRKAVAAGIAKMGEKLTQAQKVMARYLIIMEQTSKIQGDFRRTSNELANSTRILTKQIKDELSKAVLTLLPLVKDVVLLLREALTWFSKLPSSVKTATVVVAGFVTIIRALGISLASFTGPVGIFITLIGMVGGALMQARLKAIQAKQGLMDYQAQIASFSAQKAQEELNKLQERLNELKKTKELISKQKLKPNVQVNDKELKTLEDYTKELNSAGNVLKDIRTTVGGGIDVKFNTEDVARIDEEMTQLQEKIKILQEHLEQTKNIQDQLNESMKGMNSTIDFEKMMSEMDRMTQERESKLEQEVESYLTAHAQKFEAETLMGIESMRIISGARRGITEEEYQWELNQYYKKEIKKRIMAIKQDIKKNLTIESNTKKSYDRQFGFVNQFAQGAYYVITSVIAGQAIAYIDKAWERSFGKANSLLEMFAKEFVKMAVRIVTHWAVKKLFEVIGFALLFNTGGIVPSKVQTAQTGLRVGADTIPILAAPGEAIIPAQSVAENREQVQQLITQQIVNNEDNTTNVSMEINVNIQSWDGEDVMRVVNSDKFRDAMKNAIQNRIINFRVKGKGLEIV